MIYSMRSSSSSKLLTVFRQSRARSLRFAGFPLLVALDQARFIIRSRDRRNIRESTPDGEPVMTLKTAADEFDGKGE
jgi:hypothetical protein